MKVPGKAWLLAAWLAGYAIASSSCMPHMYRTHARTQDGKVLTPAWQCGGGDKPGITLDCDWTGDKGEKGISMRFATGPDITDSTCSAARDIAAAGTAGHT